MATTNSSEKLGDTLGRPIELLIQFLIVVSLITFSLETLPDLTPAVQRLLDTIEAVCVFAFLGEYLARLWFAPNRFAFVFSFFGFVDLIAIIPFFASGLVDLRFARAFRLLRIIRILKLARYNAAARRFHTALLLAKEEIVLFLAMTGIVLFLSAVGIYHFEHEAQPEQFSSVFHSLWWAITTLTTVGYGDVYPVTTGGRIFTFMVLLVGLGVVSVPAGLVSAALLKARTLEAEEKAKHRKGPDADENNVAEAD